MDDSVIKVLRRNGSWTKSKSVLTKEQSKNKASNNSDEDYTQLRFNYGKDSRTGKKGYIPDWSSIPVGFVTYNPLTNLAYKRISRDTNTAQDYIPLNPSTLLPLE